VDERFSSERIRAAYDVVAGAYEAAFGDDLSQLPLDRQMLDRAHRAGDGGLILDLGCGTGSAGCYLTGKGARVVGLDLSIGMLRSGGSMNRFPSCQGDMRHLPFRDGVFAAIVAYYSIHNVIRTELEMVLAEVARVLRPGATLLLSTHLGEGEVYSDEFLGHHIATTGGSLYSSLEIMEQVSSKGFLIEASAIRDPLAHEHQSQRIYLLARGAAHGSNAS
jgi:ubiquinone/menaquinone biosynthesis C-methylase UbiE